MAQTVVDMFYKLGGYTTDSSSPAHISAADITGTYVPLAVSYFNSLCENARTVSINWTGSVSASSSGNLLDDRIVAELSLYFADSAYDTLHVDPDDAERENRHLTIATALILNTYGIYDRKYGKLLFPNTQDDNSALASMGVANLTDDYN
jgi:hypothetical protein